MTPKIPDKLKRQILQAAATIKAAMQSGIPILFRHHGDGDGVCGGIAFLKAIEKTAGPAGLDKAWFFQNNTAYYKPEEASKDAEKLAGKGLAVLIDFAGNEESIPSLKLLRESNARIVLIDHHPTKADLPSLVDVLVSPWESGVGSEYSAGFLACLVAREIAGEEKYFDLLGKVSLTSDRSSLFKPGPEELKLAMALDFLAGKSRVKNSAQAGKEAFEDRERASHVCAEAQMKLDEAVAKARKTVKEKKLANGFTVVLVKLEKALEKGEFPSRGKICGVIHDGFAEKTGAPLVTISMATDIFNFRASETARARGFKANGLIEKFKADFKNAAEAGGGHEVAAAIKLKPGFSNIALDFFLKEIEAL